MESSRERERGLGFIAPRRRERQRRVLGLSAKHCEKERALLEQRVKELAQVIFGFKKPIFYLFFLEAKP
jgi:hypothetical protein